MTISQPPLDPRKTPWKRGDVCALGFEKMGWVLNNTPEYLEVRWTGDDGVERIPAETIDDVHRVAHADSLTPDGTQSNLETLEALESISRLKNAVANRLRAVKNETEKRELDALIKRFISPQCPFDREHTKLLFDLAIDPQRVSWYWKLRERWHRFVHHH
jgi:hypothetical protein